MAHAAKRADGEESRRHIIDALRAFEASGKHPTARELARKTGISHTNIRHHLETLQAEGRVSIQEAPASIVRQEIVLIESTEGAP